MTVMKDIFKALLLMLIISGVAYSQSTGTIKGKVSDDMNEDLISANVMLDGATIGAATDINGNYIIKNITPGNYTIIVSYIGYQKQTRKIELKAGSTLEEDFVLKPESFEGETVVVTAQARGQQQAINQQLNNKNIANVVSAARIQELPDNNAAESVGRLPGVSLLRSGGEGEKVVVRGLAPKFNAVTINGVSLSSSDAGDRGADLSMISSNMLAGIEVSKSVTADMDANAIGGVVNFQLREAALNNDGKAKYAFTLQGGRNGLSNVKDKFRNYKVEGLYENRFFDNNFGLFAQASFENRNLSSNELSAMYTGKGNSEVDYLAQNIALDDIWRIRERINGVLSLDYQLPYGKIQLSNLFSSSTTNINDRQQFYNVDRGANSQSFNAIYSKSKLTTISNILNFEHDISLFHLKATLSHSYSKTDNPRDWQVNFVNSAAGIGDFGFQSNIDPRSVVSAANNDTSSTLLQTVSTTKSLSEERAYVASIDLDTRVEFSENISAKIKFGGKYHYQKRNYDLEVTDGQNFGFASGGEIIEQLKNALPWFNHKPGDNLNVPVGQFIDGSFDYGKFLDSEYNMVYPLNFPKLQSMVDYMYTNQLKDNITYNHNVGSSVTNDYNGTEVISAAYLMAEVDLGPKIKLTPGVRYQQLKTEYTAAQGLQGPNSNSVYANELKTVTNYHPYWLPSLLLQYKPLSWFDVRLAYTNTLSYADYTALAPRINVAQSRGTLDYNGFDLKPTESQNFDAYFSFYSNDIGLFTVGGFYKIITDVIYQYSFIPRTGDELVDYYPDWVENKKPLTGIVVNKFLNNPYKVNNYGIELDWQTHFWYLPSVLSGMVFNINYTHIFSEAEYPYQLVEPGRPPKYTDTSYIAPLIYQPDDIINVTLGYDYEGFSARVSMLYSAAVFTGPTQWKQLRAFTDSYTRWDLSMKQDLNFLTEGLELYFNWNNITGADDVSSISASTGVPARIESYGSILELGIRGKF